MQALIGIQSQDPCLLPKHWIKACEIWVRTIEKLCANFVFSDAPWEYLERTNSAIFASALTASGIPSMPETYVMRDGVKVQKEQRVDICAVNEGKSIELIEFKMAEYDAIYPQTVNRINSRLKSAETQVNRITGIHGNEILDSNINIKRTVAVLGLPCFEPGTDKTKMENAIQDIIKELKGSKYDVTAWVFPPQYLENASSRYKGKFYVGTFVVAKNVTLDYMKKLPHFEPRLK